MLCFLTIVSFAELAQAHTKWFICFVDTAGPRSIGTLLADHAFTGLFLLACFVMLAATMADKKLSRMERIRDGARALGAFTRTFGPAVLRWGTAVSLVATTAFFWNDPVYLTPELHAPDRWVSVLQLSAAVALLDRRSSWLGGLAIFVLFGFAAAQYGLLHLADYPVYVGIAAVIILNAWSTHETVPKRTTDILRISVCVTFLWGGIEKFAYPSWTYPLLTEHSELLFGFDPHFWMMAAGWIECCCALAIVFLRFGAQIAAAVLFFVCACAIPLFGLVDAVGHAPFLIVLAIIAASPKNRFVPRRWSPNLLAHGAYGAAAVMLVLLVSLLGYVGLHARGRAAGTQVVPASSPGATPSIISSADAKLIKE